jgi:glycosyltransferase involved in cell wall biosynthesis
MAHHPIFLSIVLVLRNQSSQLFDILGDVQEKVADWVSDYEIIVVDNASDDESISTLKKLTQADGLPNLQVYALTKEVDVDTASWVGLECALGDFVAVYDPFSEDLDVLPEMLSKAVKGADVVFAKNEARPRRSWSYSMASFIFHGLYRSFNGIDLAHEAPHYRVLSRVVINFILQHPQPSLTYRHLPASGGFVRERVSYCTPPTHVQSKRLWDSIDRGTQLLVSTTRAPMRLVTALSLFGAFSNLIYSIYVIAVALLKEDVAEGWVSMSLQLSGMFFLISLVLLVMGEYILHMAKLSNEGPLYHVSQEFTSAIMTRHEKLNVESPAVHSFRSSKES